MNEKVLSCWSGGKDSALCLRRLEQDNRYEIVALLTILNAIDRRVSMHGVRGLFPLWQGDTTDLAREFIDANPLGV